MDIVNNDKSTLSDDKKNLVPELSLHEFVVFSNWGLCSNRTEIPVTTPIFYQTIYYPLLAEVVISHAIAHQVN